MLYYTTVTINQYDGLMGTFDMVFYLHRFFANLIGDKEL